MRQPKVSLTPIERKAEFAKHATLKGKPVSRAADEDIGVSWTHLRECFGGARIPSEQMANAVAEYVGMATVDFWGAADPSNVAVAS